MSTKSKMRGVLIYVSGDRKREMIKLRRDGTIFGREKADIIIDDTEVSSTHFQIQNIDESYHIFDMNSSNAFSGAISARNTGSPKLIVRCLANSNSILGIFFCNI